MVALVNVAKFLSRSGVGEDVVQKFIELGGAISELRNGTVADVLLPTSFGSGRGPDGTVVWSLKADVVIGLECILRSRKMKQQEAAKHIAKRYPAFNRLKRNPRDSLAGSTLSWRRLVNEGKVPESEDIQTHQRKFFEQLGDRRPGEMFALGEQLLAEAADRVTKAVF